MEANNHAYSTDNRTDRYRFMIPIRCAGSHYPIVTISHYACSGHYLTPNCRN